MKSYDKFREKQVHEVGSATQNKAEEILDKQASEPFVERYETKSGNKVRYRKNIAEIMDKKRKTEKVVKYFMVPDMSHIYDNSE